MTRPGRQGGDRPRAGKRPWVAPRSCAPGRWREGHVDDLNETKGAEDAGSPRRRPRQDTAQAFVALLDVAMDAKRRVAVAVEGEGMRFAGSTCSNRNAEPSAALWAAAIARDLRHRGGDSPFAVLTRSGVSGMKHASLAMKQHGTDGRHVVTRHHHDRTAFGAGGSTLIGGQRMRCSALIEDGAAELGHELIRVVAIAAAGRGDSSGRLVHRGRPERVRAQHVTGNRALGPTAASQEASPDVAAFLCSTTPAHPGET